MKLIHSLGSLFARRHDELGRLVGRALTMDAAFAFRMGAGMVGDVNRSHPAGIEPVLQLAATPTTLYGQACLVDATGAGVRPLVAGDQALTDIYGITVRPYPVQQQQTTNFGSASFGGEAPPLTGVIDVLRAGYIMVQLQNAAASPSIKGGAVFIWTAASAGAHVQGGFEATNPAGNGMQITSKKTSFNGAPDANGVVEIAFNV